MTDIHKIIAAVSPDNYCDKEVKDEVKELVKEKGYLEAAKKAKPSGKMSESRTLTYDSPADGLEPIYFWIIDFLRAAFKEVHKITDNFTSSPGSGHFSELQAKATRMQEEAMKLLRVANEVIRSVINLVYDLKEMKLLVQTYDELKSDDEAKKESSLLSLKQRWMDNVDVRRNQGSINALTYSLDFATLRDAFMKAESLEDVDNLDLNDRVKRILKQRLGEFFKWISESENQLKKRYEIEKRYLQSQASSLKLYSKWIYPYLKAAKKLEQNAEGQAESLVTVFNTLILELAVLARDDYDPIEGADKGDLPPGVKKAKLRKYYPLVVIEFSFRGIPQKVGQHYAFGGRTDIKFTSYALNDQEFKVVKEQIEKQEMGETMSWVEGATTESIGQIQADIDEFLNENKDKEEKKDEKKEKKKDKSVSFMEFLFPKKKEDEKVDLSKGVKSDDEYEKLVRKKAAEKAHEKCFTVYDTYKKSHGMPSHQSPYD